MIFVLVVSGVALVLLSGAFGTGVWWNGKYRMCSAIEFGQVVHVLNAEGALVAVLRLSQMTRDTRGTWGLMTDLTQELVDQPILTAHMPMWHFPGPMA